MIEQVGLIANMKGPTVGDKKLMIKALARERLVDYVGVALFVVAGVGVLAVCVLLVVSVAA